MFKDLFFAAFDQLQRHLITRGDASPTSSPAALHQEPAEPSSPALHRRIKCVTVDFKIDVDLNSLLYYLSFFVWTNPL